MNGIPKVKLTLEDGTVYYGRSFGSPVAAAGEVVFNTAMTGYPESLTDPSYKGQILCLTYPFVGNYGAPARSEENDIYRFYESSSIHISGLIVSDYSFEYSHWNASGRCEEALEFYQRVLGARVEMLMRFRESPEPPPPGMVAPVSENKVMHCAFTVGESLVMASDGACRGAPGFKGVTLSIAVNDVDSAERVFRATVEHLPAVIYREEPHAEGRPFYISPQTMDLFGHPPERWATEPGFWLGRIHPDDVGAVVALDRSANETKEPFVADYRLRRADGTWVWTHDEATYVADATGAGWWQGFMVDVTERMEAEQQLREAEETFRSIVEHNPAVIYTPEFDPRSGRENK